MTGTLCCFRKEDGSAECTKHTKERCGDGGAWLVLKAGIVVVLIFDGPRRTVQEAVWGALYLDAHGERDPYLQRGKELYLQEAEYERLRLSFVRHTLKADAASLHSLRRANVAA